MAGFQNEIFQPISRTCGTVSGGTVRSFPRVIAAGLTARHSGTAPSVAHLVLRLIAVFSVALSVFASRIAPFHIAYRIIISSLSQISMVIACLIVLGHPPQDNAQTHSAREDNLKGSIRA